MGVLADRLDSMRVRASAPAGDIVAELHNRTEVNLSFAPGSYHRYRRNGRQELERQLAALAKLLWAARMREYYRALSEALEETVAGEARPVSRRDMDYYAGREHVVAEGHSSDGRLHLMVRGMQTWTVQIANGTLEALTAEQFAEHVRAAAGELIRDQFAKIRELKQEFYGAGR